MAIETPNNQNQPLQWTLANEFSGAHGSNLSIQYQRAAHHTNAENSPIGGRVWTGLYQYVGDQGPVDTRPGIGSSISNIFSALGGLMSGHRTPGDSVEVTGSEAFHYRIDMAWGSGSGDDYVDPVERMGGDAPEQPLKFTPFGPGGSGGG